MAGNPQKFNRVTFALLAFDISKGAAMSYIVMIIMMVIVLTAIYLLRREKQARDTLYGSDAPGREAQT